MDNFPNKKCSIDFEDKIYTGNFPNNKGLLRIQDLKLANLKNLGGIIDASTYDGIYAVMLVDTFAHFTVIFPDLMEDLPGDFRDLDAIAGAKLVKVFTEQFNPWWREWREILQNGGEPVKKVETETVKEETTKSSKSSNKPSIS